MKPRIAIIATLDTKGLEVSCIRDVLNDFGLSTVVVDAGVYSPKGIQPDVRVAEDLAGLRRDAAMERLGRAAANCLQAWVETNEIDGVIGLGGNQGTAVCGMAMRGLPHGFPRAVISTVALTDVREHFEDSDVFLVSPVADLVGGPNRVNEPVLKNTARAMSAMARAYQSEKNEVLKGSSVRSRPSIALSAFGNTETAVARAMNLLNDAGFDTVAFHASGTGGPSIDRLVEEGWIAGVLDITPHELLAELYPEDIYRPVRKGRLMAAVRRGVPLVVAPGSLNYFCFGSAQEIPASYKNRPTHYHNPYNTNVRATAEECQRIGHELAVRLNQGKGPAAVLFPQHGWTENTRKGQPLYDPQADSALVDAFMETRKPHIHVEFVDAHLNDAVFSERAVGILREFMAEKKTSLS